MATGLGGLRGVDLGSDAEVEGAHVCGAVKRAVIAQNPLKAPHSCVHSCVHSWGKLGARRLERSEGQGSRWPRPCGVQLQGTPVHVLCSCEGALRAL